MAEESRKVPSKENIKNFHTERNFLAGLVKYPPMMYAVENRLFEEDFASPVAGKVYSVLRHLIIDNDVERPDSALLLATIQNLAYTFPPECNITDYVNKLYTSGQDIELKTVEIFAKEIALMSRRRDMCDCGTKLQKKMMEGHTFGNINEVIGAADEIYFETINRFVVDDEMVTLGEGAGKDLHQRADNPDQYQGFGSGFSYWDEMIGGFQPDSFNFVSGRGKVGKSMFGLNVATHVARNELIPVFLADSEMGWTMVRHRLIAHVSGVDYQLIKKGLWRGNPETAKRVIEAIPIVEALNIKYYSIRAMNAADFISACRRFLFKHVKRNPNQPETWNQCLFVWDYIKLDYYAEKNIGSNWWLDIAKSVVHFKDFLGKTQTTALVLGQQNTGGIAKVDKNGKMITQDNESIVAGSDEIVKSSSNVSSIRFKTAEEKKRDGVNSGDCLLMPFVAREGEGGSWIQLSEGVFERDYVSLQREGNKMTFKQITTNKLLRQKEDISDNLK